LEAAAALKEKLALDALEARQSLNQEKESALKTDNKEDTEAVLKAALLKKEREAAKDEKDRKIRAAADAEAREKSAKA